MDGNTAAIADQLYESLIDYGAHPNAGGTLTLAEHTRDADIHTMRAYYLAPGSPAHRLALKTAARVGWACVNVMRLVRPDWCAASGVTAALPGLAAAIDAEQVPLAPVGTPEPGGSPRSPAEPRVAPAE